MISLCYISSEVSRFSKQELIDLLSICHRNNAMLDITGLLLYNGHGSFMQVLEGQNKTVMDLYEKIQRDPRHTKITRLSKKPIDARHFPKWKMGFRNLDHLPSHVVDVFSDFMNYSNDANKTPISSGSAYSILSYFKDKSDELIF